MFQFSLNNTNDRRKEVLCLRDWRVYLETSVNNAFFLLINTIRQVSIQLFQCKFDFTRLCTDERVVHFFQARPNANSPQSSSYGCRSFRSIIISAHGQFGP